jgi:hypothetical protein
MSPYIDRKPDPSGKVSNAFFETITEQKVECGHFF